MNISKEFKVGVFGIISLSILYCGGMFLKGGEIFSTKNKYYAYAENVEGLVEGSKISINGAKIGFIKKMEFLPEENCKTKITFAIDKGIKLNTNSSLKTVGNLTGGKFLKLQIGKGENMLVNGDKIQFSQGADIVSELTQKGSPIVSDIHQVLNNLNLFLEKLNENNQVIKNTISNLEKTTKNLNDTISILAPEVSKVFDVVNDKEKGLVPFVLKMNSVADKIDRIEFNEISDNINECLKKIKDGPIFDNTNKTILETQKAIQDLDKLFVDIRQHPHNYVNFSLWGNGKKSNIKE